MRNADDAMCGMVIQMRCLKADDGDVLGILPFAPFNAYPPPSLHSPFPNPSFSGIDALLTGRSISIHPPFLVKCTFCPIPPISSRLSPSSASVPLLFDRELAGHGRIVDADNETVRIDAAKVAMKNVDVASRRVRSEGLESGRSADHIVGRSLERVARISAS